MDPIDAIDVWRYHFALALETRRGSPDFSSMARSNRDADQVRHITGHNILPAAMMPCAMRSAMSISVKNAFSNFPPDVILMRQDPPFDMQYITTTLCEHLHPETPMVNNPEVRNAPEKLLITHFPELIRQH